MPLLALTIMLSFTFSPKAARRTRKAALNRASNSSSGARRIESASSRVSSSPASALSASDSHSVETASSDMRFLLRQQGHDPLVERAGQRAPPLPHDENISTLLEQPGLR